MKRNRWILALNLVTNTAVISEAPYRCIEPRPERSTAINKITFYLCTMGIVTNMGLKFVCQKL